MLTAPPTPTWRSHGTRNRRPRPNGSEHGPAPDARRPQDRRLRRQPRCGLPAGGRGRRGRLLAGGHGVEAERAALDLDHGSGRRDHREDGRGRRRCAGVRRRDRRRRQLLLPRRHPPRGEGGREGDRLCRLRDQRRRLRARPRLLPDDRRPRPRGRAARPDLRRPGAGGGEAERTPGRSGDVSPSENGYLHCGPNGAGHFVKMVHNGIEYGVMAAYAEGLNILKNANAGKVQREADAETAPLDHPEYYQYDLDLPEVAEVWRRGSVVGSWLLDLTAAALQESPDLGDFAGRVSDSGEGRWTAIAAIDEGVPTPVLTTALQERFYSRGLGDFGDKVLSAMRKQFGGHAEKAS